MSLTAKVVIDFLATGYHLTLKVPDKGTFVVLHPFFEKHQHMRHIYLLIFCSLSANVIWAQPTNDVCDNAIVLDQLDNWCSPPGAYTTSGATLDAAVGQPNCWPDQTHDVWFTFVAQATDLHVTVIGANAGAGTPGGTLQLPQFAIYSGGCGGNLTELQCASDGFGYHIAETFVSGLTIGQTYFIRVDARNGNQGTFQLCVNNFNSVPDPSSDCPTGVVLCNKEAFTVQSIIGAGNDPYELVNGSCIQEEFSSAWYKWTCDQPGTLTFTITPTNPSDDIDFIVFELPNGLDDCSDKIELRCMSSGENVGSPFPTWEPCTGPTGLSTSSTDLQEFPGCASGDDNFVAALDMEAGKSYAVAIINFSNTGNGFSIEFGGTGTFLGPQANFQLDKPSLCLDEMLTVQDASVPLAGIQSWTWNFGLNATPATATGPGPHQVSYQQAGTKAISLTILDQAGCEVTTAQYVEVYPAVETDIEVHPDYCGTQAQTGSVRVHVTQGTPPFTFSFDGSPFGADSVFTQLAWGTYPLEIQDANGCTFVQSITVPEGLALNAQVEPAVPPTCNGDSNGQIVISLEVATLPVSYDIGNGPQADSIFTNLAAGNYTISVTDGAGCQGIFTIEIEDFPVLEVAAQAIDISCFGEQDGEAFAHANGGAGNYTYSWSTGATTDYLFDLPAGSYTVTITDANGCTRTATTTVAEPPPLSLQLIRTQDIACFGDASGIIVVQAQGGTPDYVYSVDGINFQPDTALTNLPAGNYTVTVRDSRGCTDQIQTTLDEPPPLLVDAGPDTTLTLGQSTLLNATVLPLGTPVTYAWAPAEPLSCADCPTPEAIPLRSTTFTLTVWDENGCPATDQVTVFIRPDRPIYFPNAFSPNDDGFNDHWTAYAGPAVSVIEELKIYDRWGELVFEARQIPPNDPTLGWDGTFRGQQLQPAVFAWTARVRFIDGVILYYSGDLVLLR